MKLTDTQSTGQYIRPHMLMRQWGALWLVDAAEPSTDNDVWLSLIWVSGATDEGMSTSVFYGNDEPVTLVGFSQD